MNPVCAPAFRWWSSTRFSIEFEFESIQRRRLRLRVWAAGGTSGCGPRGALALPRCKPFVQCQLFGGGPRLGEQSWVRQMRRQMRNERHTQTTAGDALALTRGVSRERNTGNTKTNHPCRYRPQTWGHAHGAQMGSRNLVARPSIASTHVGSQSRRMSLA